MLRGPVGLILGDTFDKSVGGSSPSFYITNLKSRDLNVSGQT